MLLGTLDLDQYMLKKPLLLGTYGEDQYLTQHDTGNSD